MHGLSLKNIKNINLTAFFSLIVYPIILITLLIKYISAYQLGVFELFLFLAGYYVANIAVGLGLHRLWSHDTYKTNKYIEFILVIFSAATLQGPALSWASNHFKHHAYTDTEKDPHSPLKYKNKIMGFLWSHMGWMMTGEGSYKSISKITMVKLGRNKLLRWQLKYYWPIAISMNTIFPALVGYMIGGTTISAFAGFLFIGLGRALQQQATFFVNSLCHFFGTQKYIKGTSRDVWWLFFMLLGENWHNFHHAFPSDYRNGVRWYQLDIHKWIIYLMSKCGLAWDLNITSRVRIEAKMMQTIQQTSNIHKERLEYIQNKVVELGNICQQKFFELENSSIICRKKIWKTLSNYQYKLNNIKYQLHKQIKNFENPSDKIINSINNKVSKIEQALHLLYNETNSKNSLV